MMTRRRCSRFASAKVRLFRKPAKGCKRFFKKIMKKSVERTIKGGRREDIPYLLYIGKLNNPIYYVYRKDKNMKL